MTQQFQDDESSLDRMTKTESPVFSHAIVIDFEATCYDKLERPPDGWRSEIVEFPAVLGIFSKIF